MTQSSVGGSFGCSVDLNALEISAIDINTTDINTSELNSSELNSSEHAAIDLNSQELSALEQSPTPAATPAATAATTASATQSAPPNSDESENQAPAATSANPDNLANPASSGSSNEAVSGDAPAAAVTSGFAAFGFAPELLETLAAIGYSEPSPIQKAAIPELLLGRDLVGQAQTGTGKTAAFALPLLTALDPEERRPQVLVLTPTRELALQVAEAFNTYAARLSRVRVLAIYGGADFRDQIQQLRRGVQIVVGTPGRVMDHMRQGHLDLSGLRSLVLDEADEMLRMGFIDDVEWVLQQLPEKRQVVLFSATMPNEIRRIAQSHLSEPAEITIRTKGADASRIRQRHLVTPAPQKLAVLQRVLEAESHDGVIIFARTKAITLTVSEALEQAGYDVAVLNGDVPQAQRERTIERLRDGRVNILGATDGAARGLDVERIGLIINYDIPFDSEAYVHRIGRTGRAGRNGDAILFLTPRERRFLSGLERTVGRPIEAMEVPNNATINQNRLDRLRQQLSTAVAEPRLSGEEQALLSEMLQRIAQELNTSPERLALAALELARAGKGPLLLHGEDACQTPVGLQQERGGERGGDRNGDRRRPGGREERASSPPESDMERFRIEVGWRDRVKPGNIVGAIANEAGIAGRRIGRIQIFDTHSTVDLPSGMPADVFQSLQRLRVMNKELRLSRLGG
ncbi:MAG: DEAD/DEAH box helicase [Prochlorococcaceae cyanobacterium]